MRDTNSDVTDRILGTLRMHGPLVTQELVEKTGMPFSNLYNRLRAAEKRGRVVAYRTGRGEAVMWSLNE